MSFLKNKVILILSLVSLFGDVASESLYPIIPFYLKSIGLGVFYIGLLEGLANFVSGMGRTYFGKLSDQLEVRLPFVRGGYFCSNIGRAFFATFAHPLWCVSMRSLDRLGKGMRTSVRDAMLSLEGDEKNQGAIFGFHRAMDSLGSVLGPLLGLWLLGFLGKNYSQIFYLSLIPGSLSFLLLFFIKEKKRSTNSSADKTVDYSILKSFGYWKIASPTYRKIMTLFFLFTLINSSDMFLLLRAREAGVSESKVILLYVVFNLIHSLSSFPLGHLSDKIGRKKVFIFGLLCFAVTYFGMGTVKAYPFFIALFCIYGLFNGATEGVMKAWIAPLAKKEDLGWALGFQSTLVSVGALISSLLAGIIYEGLGGTVLFCFSGIFALIIAFLFFNMQEEFIK